MQSGKRRALRDGAGSIDASVRTRLRRQALKNSDLVVEALMKGMSSSDPMISARSAVALLEQAFGRPGTATAEEAEPSKMIHTLFRRPSREPGGPDELFACLQDGRIIPVMTVSFEPESSLTDDPGGPH